MENHARSNILYGVFATIVLVLIGSFAYHFIEGWGWVDSAYFAATTLTTVGFGDFHPTHDLSKIFTIFYVFAGISVVFYTVTKAGAYSVEHRLRFHGLLHKKEKKK
ncbi:two pore domain potassium channel family protein [Candidatus Micrarchaeota archaeon]|nr:two pore domain potassium channel family protein [Candidatus Micrarchaeota archaeon]